MAQQTQVERVIPAWGRFLSDMGTPQACAEAGRGAVIRSWEGLGYHRRAVSLHAAATEIVQSHAGVVPDDLDALRALPGVGQYTARAVLAFAYERDVGVVDTNVARILARAVAGRPLTAGVSQRLADDLVTEGRGWFHNQAMLDFGWGRCSATPVCQGCPVRRSCAWARAGWPSPDPATSSSGTSRPQPRFEGSDRQLRGQILSVARRDAGAEAWREELDGQFGRARVDRALDGLIADGLVAVADGSVSIP